MSLSTILFLGLALFGNFAESKGKGPLDLEIVPSQTKYDDPNAEITLSGKATVAKDYAELKMDWILPPEIEVVSGSTIVTHSDVKTGQTVTAEIVVRFKSSPWKIIFSVYELQGDAKHGTTQILTSPEKQNMSFQSMKSKKPYSLKGLKVIQ